MMATAQNTPCHRCGKTEHNPRAFKVQCSECHLYWHHRCHIPPISDDELVARVKATNANDVDNGLAGWACSGCLGKMQISRNIKPGNSSRPSNTQRSSKQSNHITPDPQGLPSRLALVKKDSTAKVLKYKQSTAQKRPVLPGPSRLSEDSERVLSNSRGNMPSTLDQKKGWGAIPSRQAPRVGIQVTPLPKNLTNSSQVANTSSPNSATRDSSVEDSIYESSGWKSRSVAPARNSPVQATAVDADRFSKVKQTPPTDSRPQLAGLEGIPQANEPIKSVPTDKKVFPIVPSDHSGQNGKNSSNSGSDERRGPDGNQGIAPQVLDDDNDMSTSSPPAGVNSYPSGQSLVYNSPPSDAERYLRLQLGLPHDKPVDLWALEEPPYGQKPNQSYANLIKLAIMGSPTRTLTLGEIYKALIDRFECFRGNSNNMAWKDSIRNNLSRNDAFVTVAQSMNVPGKESSWCLDLSHLTIAQVADTSNSQRPYSGSTPSTEDRPQEREQPVVHSSAAIPAVHTNQWLAQSLEPRINQPSTLAPQIAMNEDIDMEDGEDDLYGPLPGGIQHSPRRDNAAAPSMDVDKTKVGEGPPDSGSYPVNQSSNKPVSNDNQEPSWMHGRFAHIAGDPWDRLLRRKRTPVLRRPRNKVQAKKLDSDHGINVENLVNFSIEEWVDRRGKR